MCEASKSGTQGLWPPLPAGSGLIQVESGCHRLAAEQFSPMRSHAAKCIAHGLPEPPRPVVCDEMSIVRPHRLLAVMQN